MDQLLLSLNYTEQEERLTLGIENVKLRPASLEKISEEGKKICILKFIFFTRLTYLC